MNIIPATIALVVLLVLGAGLILLQIFLSKKENKWLGLILPIIALCISFLAVFSVAAYTSVSTSTGGVVVRDGNGVIVQETTPEPSTARQFRSIQDTPSLIFTVVSVFLLYNIPTIVLLAVYFACREHQRRRKSLQKMQAQDLG